MTEALTQTHIIELIGVLGFSFYAGSYFLVSIGRMNSEELRYYVCKGLGAICILISLSMSFNLGSFLIQVFFIVISGIGIAKRLGVSKSAASAPLDHV
ncbi:MAG: hypothetical protein AAGF71_13185 [Pseudomonadota bacterium]